MTSVELLGQRVEFYFEIFGVLDVFYHDVTIDREMKSFYFIVAVEDSEFQKDSYWSCGS